MLTRSAEPGPTVTLATVVYDRLRDDILHGHLAPGTKLRVEFVRDRYDAGNSPVREALNRLSADGLVERHDQRGFYVAPVSRADLAELTKTRCWLEALAIREAIASGDEAWEEAAVLAFHRLFRVPRSTTDDSFHVNAEWERRHRIFHRTLISACGSRWLILYCDQLADQAYRYRQLAAAVIYPRRDERGEHETILQAALERDPERAAQALTAHYQRTAQIILDSPDALGGGG